MTDELTPAFDEMLAARNGAGPPPAADEAIPPPSVIPAKFWTARPNLSAIRDHAVGRYISADGLLAHVFAELAIRVPVDVRLPRMVGTPAPLNYGAVLVGETGTGKTTGGRTVLADAADGFLHDVEVAPLGTGEGLTAALLNPTHHEGATSRNRTVDPSSSSPTKDES